MGWRPAAALLLSICVLSFALGQQGSLAQHEALLRARNAHVSSHLSGSVAAGAVATVSASSATTHSRIVPLVAPATRTSRPQAPARQPVAAAPVTVTQSPSQPATSQPAAQTEQPHADHDNKGGNGDNHRDEHPDTKGHDSHQGNDQQAQHGDHSNGDQSNDSGNGGGNGD